MSVVWSTGRKAQEKIEFNNFGIRKNLLDYDQVNNEQREIIYAEEDAGSRRREHERDAIYKMITDTVDTYVDMVFSDDVNSDEWDLAEFQLHRASHHPAEARHQGERAGQTFQRDEAELLKEEAVKPL